MDTGVGTAAVGGNAVPFLLSFVMVLQLGFVGLLCWGSGLGSVVCGLFGYHVFGYSDGRRKYLFGLTS